MISGKDALIALANGEEVEVHESTYKKDVWFDLVKTNFNVEEILKGKVDNKPYTLEFRLKPRTITLNGIEVPAPFEPKEDERYYFITDCSDGYSYRNNSHGQRVGIAAWRTEEEIKQVVKALRNVFNP